MKGTPGVFVRSLLVALASCFLAAPSPAGAISPSIALADKIRSFEILGIHLGMTPAQVDAAIAKRGYRLTSVDSSSPGDLTHSGLCVKDYIGALREGKPTSPNVSDSGPGGNCVYWQQPAYHGNLVSGRNLLIYYCEDYPAHPGTMRVVEITFNQPLQTDADAHAFSRAVTSRMGIRPNWETKDQATGAYCSSLFYGSGTAGAGIHDSPCPQDTWSFMIVGPGSQLVDSRYPGVSLNYSLGSLALQDRDFMIAHVAASKKAIEATRSPAKLPF